MEPAPTQTTPSSLVSLESGIFLLSEVLAHEEGWYLLDDQAQQFSAIERSVDEKGHTTQALVFIDGKWRETSNGEMTI